MIHPTAGADHDAEPETMPLFGRGSAGYDPNPLTTFIPVQKPAASLNDAVRPVLVPARLIARLVAMRPHLELLTRRHEALLGDIERLSYAMADLARELDHEVSRPRPFSQADLAR